MGAFLWQGDIGTVNLNDLIDPSSGWGLAKACATNDSGQIVGYGTNSDGVEHSLLLTRVPAPSLPPSIAAGGLLFLLDIIRRVHRQK
jgi:hypothetical protein